MQVDSISITNFKLFEQSEFKFHPTFNLIVGTNGSGKTSLLRAVAAAMGGWAHAYIKDTKNRRPIGDEEIREVQIDKRFDKTKTVTIEAHGQAAIVDRFGVKMKGLATWKRWRLEVTKETITSGQIVYGSGKKYNLNFGNLGSDILTYIESGKTLTEGVPNFV